MSEEQRTQAGGDHCSVETSCDSSTPCEQTFCDKKRRKLLGMLATGGSLALAGCTGVFAAPEPTGQPGESVDRRFDVEFPEETITVSGNQNLLEAGEEHGIHIPNFCRTGFCGLCLSQVDGDAHDLVDMRINQYEPLTEELVAEGYMLPCTSRPRADLSIEPGVQLPADDDDEDDEDDEEAVETPRGRLHAIRFLEQQWTIEVGEEEFLLDAGEERGFDLPYRCREGWCGQCLAQVDGDANELVEMTTNDYDPLDEDAREDGYTLTCTGEPRDSFEIETGKYGDLE